MVTEVAVSRLLGKGWKIAETHLLGGLHQQSFGPYRLFVLVGATNRFGASYFQLFLQKPSGELSDQPVLVGLFSTGKYPAYNWFETILLSREMTFGTEHKTITDTHVQQLFQYLADLLPPGGHLMVEYESPEWRETAEALTLGIPPVATSLGYLLFAVGCGVSFKDWYFSEGGTEGPRKLQGFKALNQEHAHIKSREMVAELRAFLASTLSGSAREGQSRLRAQAVVRSLE